MEKVSNRGYWKIVRRRAWENAKGTDRMRTIGSGIVILIVAIAGFYGAYRLGQVSFDFFKDNSIATGITMITTTLVLILALAVFLISAIYRASPQLFNEHVKQINQQASEITTLTNDLKNERDKSTAEAETLQEQKNQKRIEELLGEIDKANALMYYDAKFIADSIQEIEESKPTISQRYRAADVAYRLWTKEFNDVSGITAEQLVIKR